MWRHHKYALLDTWGGSEGPDLMPHKWVFGAWDTIFSEDIIHELKKKWHLSTATISWNWSHYARKTLQDDSKSDHNDDDTDVDNTWI